MPGATVLCSCGAGMVGHDAEPLLLLLGTPGCSRHPPTWVMSSLISARASLEAASPRSVPQKLSSSAALSSATSGSAAVAAAADACMGSNRSSGGNPAVKPGRRPYSMLQLRQSQPTAYSEACLHGAAAAGGGGRGGSHGAQAAGLRPAAGLLQRACGAGAVLQGARRRCWRQHKGETAHFCAQRCCYDYSDWL